MIRVLRRLAREPLLFLHSIAFLTKLPLPRLPSLPDEEIGTMVRYFPLTGALIGTGGYLVLWGAYRWLPLGVSVILALLWETGITGALHVDGLMDTADGVFSNRPRDHMLRIMKDSRVGAMGVLAALFLYLIKWQSLSSMAVSVAGVAMVLANSAGRCALVVAMYTMPPGTPDQGSGALFKKSVRLPDVAMAAAWTLVLAFPAGGGTASWNAILAIAIGWLVGLWLTRRIGGLTGDSYGAVAETAALACYLAFLLDAGAGGSG
jgi:adenosylcobinamide-GDP ribazoletransferase